MLLIVVFFYSMKVFGFFTDEDGKNVTKLAVRVTLPAAIFCSFEDYTLDPQLLLATAWFFILTIISILLFYVLYRHHDKDSRAFAMVNGSGFNVGGFSLPIIQNFYGPFGVILTSMADLGNTFMVNGGGYAITASMLHLEGDAPSSWKSRIAMMGRCLLHSPPFVTYLVLIPIILFGWQIPAPLTELLHPIAEANSFICMCMVGLSIRTHIDFKEMLTVMPLVLLRTAFSIVTAVATYFLMPFSQEMREILALVCLSPTPSFCIISTARCKGDVGRSGLVVSLSITIGMILLLGTATVFQQM